jgi:hypothetical protein
MLLYSDSQILSQTKVPLLVSNVGLLYLFSSQDTHTMSQMQFLVKH